MNTLALLYVGSMPNGKLNLNPTVPELGAKVDSVELLLQSVVLSSQRNCTVSSPSSALLLDRRF